MKLSISQAAKMAGISRSHFYKSYLNNNRISVEKDQYGKKVIDQSELIRVFGKLHEDTPGHAQDVSKEDDQLHRKTSHTSLETENALLKQEIHFLKGQLEAAQERERWFQSQITDITASLKFLEDKRPKKRFWFLS